MSTNHWTTAEALTFDDVLLLPGYSDVLPSQVSLETQAHAQDRAPHPAALGRDGHGDRKQDRDHAGAGGRPGRHSQEPHRQGPGFRSREGQKERVGDDPGSDHASSRRPRSPQALELMRTYKISGVPVTHEGGGGPEARRHPHQPRSALRRGSRAARSKRA